MGTYNLVGANSFNTQPERGKKLLYLTPNISDRIEVQSGDVLGFYLDNNPKIIDDYSVQTRSDVPGVVVNFKEVDFPLSRIELDLLPLQHPVAPVVTLELGKLVYLHSMYIVAVLTIDIDT